MAYSGDEACNTEKEGTLLTVVVNNSSIFLIQLITLAITASNSSISDSVHSDSMCPCPIHLTHQVFLQAVDY